MEKKDLKKTKRKEELLDKLEPYLKGGFSLRKSCIKAKVSRSDIYDYMAEDQYFANKIDNFRDYWLTIVSTMDKKGKRLHSYMSKANGWPDFLFFYHNFKTNYWTPKNRGGVFVLTYKEWEKIKTKTDAFYNRFTDEQIDKFNLETEKQFEQQDNREPSRKDETVGYVYLLKSINLYKIGKTKNIAARIGQYKTENPFGSKLIKKWKTKNYSKLEQILLKICKSRKLHGEWSRLDGKMINRLLVAGDKFIKEENEPNF